MPPYDTIKQKESGSDKTQSIRLGMQIIDVEKIPQEHLLQKLGNSPFFDISLTGSLV